MALVKFQELRNTLYRLLEAATQDDGNGDNNVQAHQAMGVQLTNAMRKDGVNIIQLQNVKAIGRVTSTTVQALRELDALEVGYTEAQLLPAPEVHQAVTVEEAPAQLEYNPTVEEALMYLCKALLGAGLTVQDMVKVIRYGAAHAALSHHGNNIQAAAEALGVKTGYLHVLKRERPGVLNTDG
jgi:hypothetical protein